MCNAGPVAPMVVVTFEIALLVDAGTIAGASSPEGLSGSETPITVMVGDKLNAAGPAPVLDTS
jgi:hypothetical protein